MRQATIRTLKTQAAEYFSLLTLLRSREAYRDELADELSRIDCEIEDLDAKLLASMKNVGATVLKLYCRKSHPAKNSSTRKNTVPMDE
ncbi:MAG: hypothetical protein IJQ82_06325 [Selenomonadaceae bacterium]|nr:hypothetical protein [Selenomonadaceae bacterium]